MKDEKLNGLITPDGEYVRLDDLKAMERALRRLNAGGTKEVLRGLRSVAVELAKEYEDDAARRFLLRAREIVRKKACEASQEGVEMVRLGVAFERIERYDLAGECYEYGQLVGQCDHVSWYFLHNHAYCLAMLERFAEAEPLARQAIAILPQRHNAHKNLGLALMGQDRLREAAESFRRARDLSPTDGRAQYYLAMVEERLQNEAGVRDPRLVN